MYFNNHINVLIRSKSYLPVLQIYFLPRTYMFMNLIKMDIINHRYNKVHPVDKIPRALPLSSSRCSSTHSWFFSEWISIYKPSDMWQTLWHQSSEPLKQNKIKPISCSASPNKKKKETVLHARNTQSISPVMFYCMRINASFNHKTLDEGLIRNKKINSWIIVSVIMYRSWVDWVQVNSLQENTLNPWLIKGIICWEYFFLKWHLYNGFQL